MAEPATARIPINFELGEKAYRQRDGPRHDVSSQSRTKLRVPSGAPDHCRGGERFSSIAGKPSRNCCTIVEGA